jgi:hypothetical protein
MPNDAKLGLVVGVGVVIAIAVLFFQKEGESGLPLSGGAAAAAVNSQKAASQSPVQRLIRPVKARTTTQTETSDEPQQKEHQEEEK